MNITRTLRLFALLSLAGITGLPLHAQKKELAKYLSRAHQQMWIRQPKSPVDFSQLRYVGPTVSIHTSQSALLPQSAERNAALSTLVPDGAVSLSDGKGSTTGTHSIVPSALTVLGSDAFKSRQDRNMLKLRQESTAERVREYLTPQERAVWAEQRDKLGYIWRLVEPTPIENLRPYLTHEVPPATFADAQESYTAFVKRTQAANHEITAKMVYSSLPNEAKPFSLDEIRFINKTITEMRFAVMVLRNTFVKDPYLLNQQKYWDKVMGAFNPLLEGLLLKLDIPRPDKRVYDYHEFVLSNPDHSTPYLPESHSLIEGEEEEEFDEDEDDPSAKPALPKWVLERQHDQRMMAYTQEADELLPFIPENLRIAFINDDLNPRLNFQSWGQKGLLGKGAQVEVFAEGASFLNNVRRGMHYDLVITDLLVPHGGITMMEELRDLDPFVAVIASSKFYPGDGDIIKTDSGKEVVSTEDYFHAGLDGYMWYNNNLNAGAYGYIQVLRSLKNYYYYKQLHGWSR